MRMVLMVIMVMMVMMVMMVIGVVVILMVVVLGKARRDRPYSRVHLPSYQSGRRNSTMKDERTKSIFVESHTNIYSTYMVSNL